MDEKQAAERADSRPRKPYQAPALRRLGSVADITRATGSKEFLLEIRDQDNLPEWLRTKP
jgi:hypothetical protein